MARPTKRGAPRQDRTHSTILACPQRRPHSRPQCRIVRRLSQRRGRIQHLRTTRLRNRPARADPRSVKSPRARTRDPTPTASCDKFQPCRRPDDETGRAQGRSSLRRLYASPPTPAWSRTSTPSTTSARPRRPTSKAKPMRDGSLSANAMTTAAFREVRWIGRRSRSCWTTSGRGRST